MHKLPILTVNRENLSGEFRENKRGHRIQMTGRFYEEVIQKPLDILMDRMDSENYRKLCAIKDTRVHQFISEAAEICNPKDIFICSDTPD